MAGPAGALLSGQHARRASESSLLGMERRAEIAFQRDRDREGGGLSRQLACEINGSRQHCSARCLQLTFQHVVCIAPQLLWLCTLATWCSALCRFQPAAKDVEGPVCVFSDSSGCCAAHGALALCMCISIVINMWGSLKWCQAAAKKGLRPCRK